MFSKIYFSYENLAMSTWTKMNSFNFGWSFTISSSKLIQIRSGSDHKEELSTGWIQTLFHIDPKMFEFSDLRIHKSEVWIQPLCGRAQVLYQFDVGFDPKRINLSVLWKLSTISVLMIWNTLRKLVNLSKARARNDEIDFSNLSFDECIEPRKGSDLNLDGKVSVLEFFLSFPDLESLLEEDL